MSVSAVVPASPDQTWATVADLSRFGEWLVLHEGWRGDVPKEITTGTELTSVVTVKGLRNRIAWRVDDHHPPRSMTISGKGVGGVRVSLVLSVRPDGGHASVGVDAKISGPPTIGPMGLVIGWALRSDLRRSVAALTDLLTGRPV